MNLFIYLEFVWPEPCQLTMKRCAGGGGGWDLKDTYTIRCGSLPVKPIILGVPKIQLSTTQVDIPYFRHFHGSTMCWSPVLQPK